jgi:hypothetical protein
MSAIDSFRLLLNYCERQQFKGWDPYDGLNSKVFQAIPFASRSAFLRLCVIQGFKRSPINLRPLALIAKDYNPKGIALCLHAYANLAQLLEKSPNLQEVLGCRKQILEKINKLAQLLISLRSEGNYHGACWGYNFDWQSRRSFLFPKYTPTVVATTFAVDALHSAYLATGNQQLLDMALTSAEFVMQDLHRTKCERGFIFSYSPFKGNDTVYNASLLGSKLLALCYHYTQNSDYLQAARESVIACCEVQREDGAWVYGAQPVQSWVDSFHTGYNLVALHAYEQYTGDKQFHHAIEKGFNYYIENFFESDGCPKYYDNKKYPIDIHCPAQLLVTLAELGFTKQYQPLAEKVLHWTDENMRSQKEGFYYYQLKRGISSKISYMRWSNAFMLYALSHYLKSLSYGDHTN